MHSRREPEQRLPPSLERIEEVLDVKGGQMARGQGVQPAQPRCAAVQHLRYKWQGCRMEGRGGFQWQSRRVRSQEPELCQDRATVYF